MPYTTIFTDLTEGVFTLTLNPITDDPEYDYVGLEPGQRVENIRVEEVLWEIVEDWVRSKGSM